MAEEARKAEAKARMAELEAAKAEEARLKAEADARAQAEADAANKEAKAAREAQQAADSAAAEADAAAAAAAAAADADAAAKRQEDVDRWAAAVAKFTAAADAILAEPGAVDALERIAAAALGALEEGEPGGGEAGAVLCLGGGGDKGTLRVLAATEERSPGGLQPGAEEPAFGDKAGGVSAATHGMIAGGAPTADVDGVRLAALSTASGGGTLGALLSGGDGGRPPAVPAEFLSMMATALGPVLDRAYRGGKLYGLAGVAKYWLDNLCEGGLSSVEWDAGSAPATTGDHHLHITDPDGGAHLGSIVVVVKPGASLNAFMTDMIEVTKGLMQEAADDLLALGMGDGEPDWLPEGLKGLKGKTADFAARCALLVKLVAYVRDLLLKTLTKDTIGELKSYNSPPEAVKLVMQGVLLLINRAAKLADLPEWKECRGKIDLDIVKECAAFDASLKGHKKQWVESKKASKGLTSDEVAKKGSAAVQVFQKWVEIQRVVRHIAEQLRKEAKEAGAGDQGAADDEEEEEEE